MVFMHKIFLGLGSNVEDRGVNIQKAIKFLEEKISLWTSRN